MKHLKKAQDLLNKITSYSFRKLIAALWDEAEQTVTYLLKEYNIKPVIVGGLAVQHFGYRRMTEDIDILISREAYTHLEQEGKIKFGQLKTKPGVQIDVLTEGKDNNPDPETVRDGDSLYPTFEGLIYLKLLSGRDKDKADVTELLKINGLEPELYYKVVHFLPDNLITAFDERWRSALSEVESGKGPERL